MSRPFSQTMQAHELDVHRLWLVLLSLSGLLLVVWASWAGMESIVVYEYGSGVQLSERVSRSQSVEQEGNVYRVRTWQQRWLQACFPQTARGKLQPGQPAVVLLRGEAEPPGVAAVITEVKEDRDGAQGTIRVTLRADIPQEAADPFAQAVPERVQVEVGRMAPISLLLSGRAPGGPKLRQ